VLPTSRYGHERFASEGPRREASPRSPELPAVLGAEPPPNYEALTSVLLDAGLRLNAGEWWKMFTQGLEHVASRRSLSPECFSAAGLLRSRKEKLAYLSGLALKGGFPALHPTPFGRRRYAHPALCTWLREVGRLFKGLTEAKALALAEKREAARRSRLFAVLDDYATTEEAVEALAAIIAEVVDVRDIDTADADVGARGRPRRNAKKTVRGEKDPGPSGASREEAKKA